MSEPSSRDDGEPSAPVAPLPAAGATAAPKAATAGSLLRAARESQGLHIAALAAAMKVTPRKLEALENDRLQELPDATFARALAQTICRSLKIDPKPVLALLPPAGSVTLETASRVQSTPFKQKPDRSEPAAAVLWRPLLWGSLLLLAAAAAVFLMPSSWLGALSAAWSGPAPTTVASTPAVVLTPAPAALSVAPPALGAAAAGAGSAASALLTGGASAPGFAATASGMRSPTSETVFSAPAGGGSAAPAAAGALVVTTTESSWVEVRDARGQVLLSETVLPGRSVGLDGPLPLQVLVGNAASTQMTFMGRPVDLAARARENIARFELK